MKTLNPANQFASTVQVVEVIEPHKRDQRIDELLQKYHKSRKNRVIVFVLYKKEASRVEAQLGKKGWKVKPIPQFCSPVSVHLSFLSVRASGCSYLCNRAS